MSRCSCHRSTTPLSRRRFASTGRAADLRDARRRSRARSPGSRGEFEPTPAGLGITVAWGLPYFRRYVPRRPRGHLPTDLRATQTRGGHVRVLEDAIRFPSDPDSTILEQNDVAVLLRSDSLAHLAAGSKALFDDLDGIFRVTSIRRGFAGGGFDGGTSLPEADGHGSRHSRRRPDPRDRRAVPRLHLDADGCARPAPDREPRDARLRRPRRGRATSPRGRTCISRICSRTSPPGIRPSTFRRGWTRRSGRDSRCHPTPRRSPRGPTTTQTAAQVKRDYAPHRQIGHSGSLQSASRLDRDVVGADEMRYPKGTAVPQRADFNTLDNPFHWSVDPVQDGLDDAPQRASISSSSTRRATTFAAFGWRWTGCCPMGRGSPSRCARSVWGSIRS